MTIKVLSAALKHRPAYELVNQHLDREKLDNLVQVVLKHVDEYYVTDKEAQDVDKEILYASIKRSLSNPKHEDMFSKILDRAYSTEVSVANVTRDIIEEKRAQIGNELAAALATKKDDKVINRLLREYEELSSLTSLDKVEAELPDEIVGINLDYLVNEALSRSGLIKVAPKALNDRLDGGMLPGNHMVVFARPECFDRETEVLTTEGWKFVGDVKDSDRIAAVDKNRQISFELPKTITKQYHEKAFHFFNKKGQLDMTVSPGHRVVYTEDGVWKEALARDVNFRQGMKLQVSGFSNPNSKESLTPQQRLAVAYQADGRSRVYKTNGYRKDSHLFGYEITLKKPRKIKRLDAILAQCDVEFTKTTNKRGYACYYIKADYLMDKEFEWIDLEKVSGRWAGEFLRELCFWDGSKRSDTRFKYSNTNLYAIDKVQAVAAMSGFNCLKSTYVDKRGYGTVYELHLRSSYCPIDGQSVCKEEVDYQDLMYCFEVSTGMLMTRRNGRLAISGNCGKTAAVITMIEGFLLQDLKVLYLGNEDMLAHIAMRVATCITRMTKDQIAKDPEQAQERLARAHHDKLILRELLPGTIEEIDQLAGEFKPSVIIIDQLRNLKGSGENAVANHEEAAKGVRNIGKKHKAVTISVTQAWGQAEGQLILTMNDIDSSKTGIPGAADVILGIGVNEQYEAAGLRKFTLCKNKLGGVHEDFDVHMNHQLSRMYTDG